MGLAGMLLLVALGLLILIVGVLLLYPLGYWVGLQADSTRGSGVEMRLEHGPWWGLRFRSVTGDNRWHLRLFRWHLSRDSSGRRERRPSGKDKSPTPGDRTWRRGLALIRDEKARSHLLYLWRRVWTQLKPRRLRLRGEVGFSEPHLTGWIMGLAQVLETALPERVLEVEIKPLWSLEGWDVEAEAQGEVRLARLLWLGVTLGLHRQSRRLYRLWKRG